MPKQEKVYVVAGVWSGILQDVHVIRDEQDAKNCRDSMAKEYGLTDSDIPDNQHSKECRWNGENEVHLHPAVVQ